MNTETGSPARPTIIVEKLTVKLDAQQLSNGETVPNPRYLRKSEKALKRLQRRVYRKKKGSANRFKVINKLGRKHLKVSRQRKDFAIKTTPGVVK